MKILLTTLLVVVILTIVWSAGQWWYVNYKLEKPKYTLLEQKDGYQIREYAPYIVASAVVPDDENTLNRGFSIVADYIFGNNTKAGQSESVAMTAPVISNSNSDNENITMTAPVLSGSSESVAMTAPVLRGDAHDGFKTVSFVMPSKYTLETLPVPNSDKVTIEQVPAQQWAVLSFRGLYDKAKQERLVTELRDMLERDETEYTSEWQFAGYDPPSTLPFLRTNEIWVKLK